MQTQNTALDRSSHNLIVVVNPPGIETKSLFGADGKYIYAEKTLDKSEQKTIQFENLRDSLPSRPGGSVFQFFDKTTICSQAVGWQGY